MISLHIFQQETQLLETQSPQYMTVQEAAQHLRVGPVTVYRYIQRGELAAVRLGGSRLRVRQEDVDGLLTENKKERNP
jgi:excisionase family DNA binding protein